MRLLDRLEMAQTRAPYFESPFPSFIGGFDAGVGDFQELLVFFSPDFRKETGRFVSSVKPDFMRTKKARPA